MLNMRSDKQKAPESVIRLKVDNSLMKMPKQFKNFLSVGENEETW